MKLIKNNYFGDNTYFSEEYGMYISKYPKEKSLSHYYSKDYWDSYIRKSKIKNFLKQVYYFLPFNESKYISDNTIINSYKKLNNNSILEVGCGFGKNVLFLHNKKIDIETIETDINIVNKLKNKNIKAYNGFYGDLNIKKKYDILYLRHVLEHFENIENIVSTFKNNLKKEGIVYINVPNCENKLILKNSIHEHPHIYHFNRDSLKKIFEKNGFKTLDTSYYSWKDSNKIKLLMKNISNKGNLIKDTNKKGEFLIGIFQLKE